FIEGESLAARIAARGRLGEADLARVLLEALEVLEYLHGLPQPLLHRDLKPDNILLRPSGELVLVDFGSARRLSGSRTHGAALAVRAALRAGAPPRHRIGRSIAVGLALGIPLVAGGLWLRPPEALETPAPIARPTRPLTAAQWFERAKPSCNALEVSRMMRYL